MFEAWNKLTIQPLGYCDMFNELSINILSALEASDPDNMGRDHLEGYFYLDDGTFLGIKSYIDTYNQMVANFIQDTIEMLRLDISQHAPRLEEYDNTRNQPSSYYHLVNIEKYIWRRSWNEDIHLLTRPTRLNEFELIIQRGQAVIAVGDKEN